MAHKHPCVGCTSTAAEFSVVLRGLLLVSYEPRFEHWINHFVTICARIRVCGLIAKDHRKVFRQSSLERCPPLLSGSFCRSVEEELLMLTGHFRASPSAMPLATTSALRFAMAVASAVRSRRTSVCQTNHSQRAESRTPLSLSCLFSYAMGCIQRSRWQGLTRIGKLGQSGLVYVLSSGRWLRGNGTTNKNSDLWRGMMIPAH